MTVKIQTTIEFLGFGCCQSQDYGYQYCSPTCPVVVLLTALWQISQLLNGALKLTSIAPILIKRQIRIIAYQPQALASFLLTKD